MITRCDHCGCKFEVSADLVYSSDPGVRCGECMSLFDARANLYDENVARSASATYRPVQKNRIIEPVDPGILESADTVVSEHFYQSSRVTETADTAYAYDSAYDSSNANYPDQSSPDQSSPDIDLSGSHRSSDYPDYHLPEHQHAASDLEFERTIATESTFAASGIEAPYREGSVTEEGRRPVLPVSSAAVAPAPAVAPQTSTLAGKSQQEIEQMAADEIRQLKQKAAGERERRALSIEPQNNGLDAEKMRQIEEFKARNADQNKLAANNYALDKELPSELGFIPEDVLQKPQAHRDDGRSQESLHFESDTPRFDTSLNGRQAAQRPGVAPDRHHEPTKTRSTDGQYDQRSAQESQSSALRHEGQGPELRRAGPAPRTADHHRQARPSARRAASNDNRNVGESSAQEMRRYQHYRPAVAVSQHNEEVGQSVKATNKQGGLNVGLWLCAIIAAACVAMYAARNLIADMNLPEPLLSSFCQVTGCVPSEPRKDSSQLQTMRKRVYSHPDIENALVISIDLMNQSVYKQPYPALALTLLDADGNPVAERRFESTDYEIVDRSDAAHLMPDVPTRIKIEVVDSGLSATDVELTYD